MNTPSDNRDLVIQRAKDHLLKATNIEDRKEEMQVLDNFLLRCWQMGWLKQYDYITEEESATIDTGDHSAVKQDNICIDVKEKRPVRMFYWDKSGLDKIQRKKKEL